MSLAFVALVGVALSAGVGLPGLVATAVVAVGGVDVAGQPESAGAAGEGQEKLHDTPDLYLVGVALPAGVGLPGLVATAVVAWVVWTWRVNQNWPE